MKGFGRSLRRAIIAIDYIELAIAASREEKCVVICWFLKSVVLKL